MPNHKSSTSGNASVPGAAVRVNPSPVILKTTGGTSSGANVAGIGPTTVIKPPPGLEKAIQQLVFGTSKDLPAGGNLTVAGQPVSQAQILAILQPALDAFTAIDDAEKVVKQQRLSLSALLPQVRQFMANLKDALIAQFGRGNPILKDFGIKDGTTRRKTKVVAKAAAQVKGQQTRELRNTQGKVEKLAVKFTGQVSPPSAVKLGTPGGGPAGGSPGSGAA